MPEPVGVHHLAFLRAATGDHIPSLNCNLSDRLAEYQVVRSRTRQCHSRLRLSLTAIESLCRSIVWLCVCFLPSVGSSWNSSREGVLLTGERHAAGHQSLFP